MCPCFCMSLWTCLCLSVGSLTLLPCSYASDASLTPSSACGASGFTAKLARVACDLSNTDTSMDITGTLPRESEAVNRLLGRASVTPGRACTPHLILLLVLCVDAAVFVSLTLLVSCV